MNAIKLHNIYNDLCGLLPMGKKLHDEICAVWQLDEQQFSELWFGAIPSAILNAIVCGELYKTYGAALKDAPGFRQNSDGSFTLDLHPYFAHRGFMMPVRNTAGMFHKIAVYRNASDFAPFELKTRKQNIYVVNA